jgi:ABC-2 type transport system permease protein
MHVAAGDDARADLLGKNLETALVAGAVTVVEALLLAAVSGGWEYVPAVLAVGALALGVVLGIGNVTSVLMPVAMPESGTNAWATNATQGMQTLGPVFLSMLVVGVAVAPGVVGSVVLVDRPVGLVGLMGVEAAAGYGAWRLGLRIGVRRSAGRQAELLAALSGADSG